MKELTAIHFLSAERVADLVNDLTAAEKASKTTIIGCWCADRGFAVTVEVVGGKPLYWRVEGPMTKELAKIWLHAMTTPASDLVDSRVLN